MTVRVRAPGSCGELVQGTLNGRNFLVTCPIDLYATAEIGAASAPSLDAKAAAAAAAARAYLGLPAAGPIRLSSELPRGKGMASSSADISAVCQAVAVAAGRRLSPGELARLAAAIEPTDGIFYPGIVMFDHIRGICIRRLGLPPAIRIAVFDAGGEVDTLGFNRRGDLQARNRAKESQVREALDWVERGVAAGDPARIGRGATLSARANQHLLPKAGLEELIAVADYCGAVGINAAHSGTVVGALFDETRAEGLDACIRLVRARCPAVSFMRTVRLIAGGLEIEGGDADAVE